MNLVHNFHTMYLFLKVECSLFFLKLYVFFIEDVPQVMIDVPSPLQHQLTLVILKHARLSKEM